MVYGQSSASPILLAALGYARDRGEALVAGAGVNLVPVVHVDDLAAAYTLALTRGPAGTVLNVAATTVMGRDLARAISFAAGLEGVIVERTPADFVSALGPLAGALMIDLRLSNFAVTERLGWTPSAPTVLYELLHGSLSQTP
jgi:nucleoside-diphosphate-sugar epimerase